MGSVHQLDHPLVAHHLVRLRDKNTTPETFRSIVERLTILKRSGWIDETDLPAELLSGVPERPTVSLPPDGVDFQDLVGGFEAWEEAIVNPSLQSAAALQEPGGRTPQETG